MFRMTKEEALQAIADLIMALQNGTPDEERIEIDSLCYELSGEHPTRADLREHIDADY